MCLFIQEQERAAARAKALAVIPKTLAKPCDPESAATVTQHNTHPDTQSPLFLTSNDRLLLFKYTHGWSLFVFHPWLAPALAIYVPCPNPVVCCVLIGDGAVVGGG